MNYKEECSLCETLIHNGDLHIRHFHSYDKGREIIICKSCLQKRMAINNEVADEFWRINRILVPPKHKTKYNSNIPVKLVRAYFPEVIR